MTDPTDAQLLTQHDYLMASIDKLGDTALEWKARAEAAEAEVARLRAVVRRLTDELAHWPATRQPRDATDEVLNEEAPRG